MLTEFEAALVPLATRERGRCAGAAYSLRQELATGETWANSLAHALAKPWLTDNLDKAGQLVAFTALTGA